MIGDSQDIVEVDETHLLKAKYNVGRVMTLSAVWLFGIEIFNLKKFLLGAKYRFSKISILFQNLNIGGISHTTKKVFGKIVPDRTTDTLLPIMQSYIDQDSFICSDMWRACNPCGQIFR